MTFIIWAVIWFILGWILSWNANKWALMSQIKREGYTTLRPLFTGKSMCIRVSHTAVKPPTERR